MVKWIWKHKTLLLYALIAGASMGLVGSVLNPPVIIHGLTCVLMGWIIGWTYGANRS